MFEEKLNIYFNKEQIKVLKSDLNIKTRSNIINENFFAKIGKNDESSFYNNLKKELALYIENKNNPFIPKLVDSFQNESFTMIILKRINGKTLSNHRNNYNSCVREKKRIFIAKKVLNIKNIYLSNSYVDDKYDRREKFEKYFERSKKFLPRNTINKIKKLESNIILENYERVLSHGDLIGPNIITNNDNVFFIDWEFFSMKPRYYDLIYFLLFSKTNKSTEIIYKLGLTNNEIKEALKDGIIICLKEIQNNAKLFNKVDEKIVFKNINRWKRELKYILEEF